MRSNPHRTARRLAIAYPDSGFSPVSSRASANGFRKRHRRARAVVRACRHPSSVPAHAPFPSGPLGQRCARRSRVSAFYLDVAIAGARTGFARTYVLTVNGTVHSVLFDIHHRGRFCFLLLDSITRNYAITRPACFCWKASSRMRFVAETLCSISRSATRPTRSASPRNPSHSTKSGSGRGRGRNWLRSH